MAKMPAFQFYPGDWLKDPDLRFCSPFARALLIDLLCLCFDAKRRGVLARANGTPWTAKDIASAVGTGMTVQQIEDALAELEENSVLKREESTGCLYSARMVRDEEIRQTRKQSGSKGGSKRVANLQANAQAKSRSSSSSSSSSSEVKERDPIGSCRAKPPDDDSPDENPAKKKNPTNSQAREILDHLNASAGKSYEPVDANLSPIKARIGEYGTAKLMAVVDAKCSEWRNDEQMAKYLRPATLFNATKCAQYVGDLGAKPRNGSGDDWRNDPMFQGAL